MSKGKRNYFRKHKEVSVAGVKRQGEWEEVKSRRCARGGRVVGAEREPKSESLTCFIYSRRILFRFISD